MRIAIFIGVISLCLLGCNRNQIEIQNLGDLPVHLNFRAEITTIAGQLTTGEKTAVVDEIPNGTYEYNTTYEIPGGYTGSASEALSGDLSFKQGKTKILIVYSSYYSDSTKTYHVGATVTSSSNSADPVSP